MVDNTQERWDRAMRIIRATYPHVVPMDISRTAYRRAELSGSTPLRELEAMADEPGDPFPSTRRLVRKTEMVKVDKKYDKIQILYVHRSVAPGPMGDTAVPPDRHVFEGTAKDVLRFSELLDRVKGDVTQWLAVDGTVLTNFRLMAHYLDEVVRGRRKSLDLEISRLVEPEEESPQLEMSFTIKGPPDVPQP